MRTAPNGLPRQAVTAIVQLVVMVQLVVIVPRMYVAGLELRLIN